MALTNKDRNAIKKEILNQLTHDEYGIFDKKEGYAKFNGTNLEMVIQCVVDGLTKYVTNN